MRHKLLATDIDGTLFNSESQLTERTRTAILAAIGRGMLFVPSTGRPMGGTRQVRAAFDFDLPMILFNGAMAVTAKTGRVLFSQGLDFGCAEAVFAEGVGRGYPVIAWAGETLFVSEDCEEVRIYQSITGAEVHVVADLEPMRPFGVTKMLWIIPPEDAEHLRDEMLALLGGRINCHTSQSYLLEFVDAGASKGRALEEIGKAYGIAREEMIAVGDGWNDVSMLETAGLGVAMGNAPEEIKRLCGYVTLSNDEDGVARVVEEFML